MKIKFAAFILIIFLFIIPRNSAMAVGLGVYFNGGVGESIIKAHYINFSTGYKFYKYLKGLDYLYGGGFLLDTNVDSENIFNYRLHIGCDSYIYPKKPPIIWNHLYIPNCSKYYTSRINIKNTFGFGFFRNSEFRLWIGPFVAANYYIKEKTIVLFHLGLTLGVNYKLTNLIYLTLELGAYAPDLVVFESYSEKNRRYSIDGYMSFGILFRINNSNKIHNIRLQKISDQ